MKAIRTGIYTLISFSVFAHGAVEVWSVAALQLGAAILFLLWGWLGFRAGKVDIRWSPLFWPLLAFFGLGVLQWLARLTMNPYLTKAELLKLAAYLLVFFLASQSFRTADEWQGFAWFLLALGFFVAVLGLLQHFTFAGKLYWVRELRYGGIPFGPYVNRNHFAGLMELIVPTGLAVLVLRAERERWLLVALFTVLPVGALFLSASRGGILSFFAQIGLLAVLVWARPGGRRYLPATAVVALLAVIVGAWLGVGSALERLGTIRSVEVSERRRLAMMKDTWRIFLDHPHLGTGLGTLVAVYPRYESAYDGKVVNHAHNDYVEALAETGWVGGLCGLVFLVMLLWSARANLRSAHGPYAHAVRVGAVVACSGLLVHGLMDFNLHIPSNALLFLLQAFLACSTTESLPSS